MMRAVATGGLTLIAVSMQGCDISASHSVPTWFVTIGYLKEFEVIPKGMSASDAIYNSCSDDSLDDDQICNGHGSCQEWSHGENATTSFCACDRDFADPECRTRRKSQLTSFVLSLLLGCLGADMFYLGYYLYGAAKLATFGGFGIWWIIDIVRTGSAPVFAYDNYRLAADLDHWVFVFISVWFFLFLGYIFFTVIMGRLRKRRMRNKLFLEMEEEYYNNHSSTLMQRPQDRMGMPTNTTYRMPYPAPGYGTHVSDAVKISSYKNPNSSYAVFGRHF